MPFLRPPRTSDPLIFDPWDFDPWAMGTTFAGVSAGGLLKAEAFGLAGPTIGARETGAAAGRPLRAPAAPLAAVFPAPNVGIAQ